MVFQEAMDIDFLTEAGPTEETVGALIEYLVGPLLPLKHTDIAKETPSESKQNSVAKQVHAAAVLYNYYHLNDHRESEFLKFDQFCNLAIMFKPSMLPHMKYMCQLERPLLDDPEKQLSLTEKAIMDACTISETLLDASANVSSLIKEWPITKVAVLLIDSQKENCFLQFDNGVWSVIEKDLYPEESNIGSKGKKRMRNHDEGEAGFQQLAFSAVKELTGIGNDKLKVLESHVVYSLSRAKTATHFFIVQSTQSISEDNLVPIQDAISSLQGPVVKKSSGSWVITPVVEYYYLLPYAEIISKLFSRGSGSVPHQAGKGSADTSIIRDSHKSFDKVNGESKRVFDKLQVKSKLDSGSVHNNNSSKEELHDSQITKNGCNFNTCSDPVSEVSDACTIQGSQKSCEKGNGESNRVSDNVQVKSKLDSGSVHSSNSTKEEPRDNCVAINSFNTNKHSEPVSKVPDDVVTSPLKENLFDRDAKETENFMGNRISGANSDSMKQKDMNGSYKVESNNSSSGAISKVIDKPLKVYRHEKRTTSTKAISSKQENLKDSKKMSIISLTKDEKPDGEKKSCMVLRNEDRLVTVNHAVEDFHITVDAKRSELSETALRALLHKRQKLYDQQLSIEGELISCDKMIQAIMSGGVGDCLSLKLEAVINCCNEICQQDSLQPQEHANLHGDRSLPLLGKSLSEAQLTLRKACQELDDICLSNNWMLPSYCTTRSNGGYVANVSVKGTNFECSGLSGIQPSIHEARNSAATHVITKLQQMASEHNTALV